MKELHVNKKWIVPELLVLGRNKPEEAVLTGCKGDGWEGPGVTDRCRTGSSGSTNCKQRVTS